MVMTPKQALVKDGFLPKGSENKRGRLSLAANERLKELSATGWQIKGFDNSRTDASGERTVTRVSIDPNRIVDMPDEARSENLWTAQVPGGRVGMRTIENLCGNSLSYCRCAHPRVWVNNVEVPVTFKPASKPIPSPRFW